MRKLEQQLGTRHLAARRPQPAAHPGRPVPAGGRQPRAAAARAWPKTRLRQFARGERGTLRIGMECHPCYQWLLKVVSPYLAAWPDVDVDVKQKFQFGGIGALFGYEIDMLVTPDPLLQARPAVSSRCSTTSRCWSSPASHTLGKRRLRRASSS